MKEKACNLWLEAADFRCILTTGAVGSDGAALIDSKLGQEAVQRFVGLEAELGRLIAARGNHVHLVKQGLLSFPTRQFRWSLPSLQIIERSAHELAAIVGASKTLLPRPGCDSGELAWADVSKALAFLPDNIIVIDHA